MTNYVVIYTVTRPRSPITARDAHLLVGGCILCCYAILISMHVNTARVELRKHWTVCCT